MWGAGTGSMFEAGDWLLGSGRGSLSVAAVIRDRQFIVKGRAAVGIQEVKDRKQAELDAGQMGRGLGTQRRGKPWTLTGTGEGEKNKKTGRIAGQNWVAASRAQLTVRQGTEGNTLPKYPKTHVKL